MIHFKRVIIKKLKRYSPTNNSADTPRLYLLQLTHHNSMDLLDLFPRNWHFQVLPHHQRNLDIHIRRRIVHPWTFARGHHLKRYDLPVGRPYGQFVFYHIWRKCIGVSLGTGSARRKIVVPLKIFDRAQAEIIKFASVEGADAVDGRKEGEDLKTLGITGFSYERNIKRV